MDSKHWQEYYVRFVIALGVVAMALCLAGMSFANLDAKFLLLAAVTIFLSARVEIQIPHSSGHITISDTFIFLTMLLYGGGPATLLAAAEGAYSSYRFGDKLKTVAFNGAQMMISTYVTASVMGRIFGPPEELPSTDNLGRFLSAICVMSVVQYIINSGLASVYMAFKRGLGVAHTWSRYYLWSSITHLAGASAAGLISRVVIRFGFSYVLLTAPIVAIVYLTYRTYLKSVETSAAQAEQAERERMREHYAQMEKLSALGELASGVAHNFNNTLTGILARAQLMLDATDMKDVRRGLRIIIQTAEDGAKTVKRIQDFARQRRDQDFVRIDVDQLMLEVAEITRPRWKDHAEAVNVHIKLVRQIGSNAVIMGDAGELREVLVNMVFNAVDAMADGGTLTLSTQDAGDEVMLTVADTGTGMAEDVRSRIFDPFFTTKGKAGMGLGLSVSYGIILLRHHPAARGARRGRVRGRARDDLPHEVPGHRRVRHATRPRDRAAAGRARRREPAHPRRRRRGLRPRAAGRHPRARGVRGRARGRGARGAEPLRRAGFRRRLHRRRAARDERVGAGARRARA
jgi:signal transduction histidine kinase